MEDKADFSAQMKTNKVNHSALYAARHNLLMFSHSQIIHIKAYSIKKKDGDEAQ